MIHRFDSIVHLFVCVLCIHSSVGQASTRLIYQSHRFVQVSVCAISTLLRRTMPPKSTRKMAAKTMPMKKIVTKSKAKAKRNSKSSGSGNRVCR